MFPIDGQYDYASIQQFASQAEALTDEERQLFDACFTGDRDESFYQGLLTGSANAYSILNNADMNEQQKQDALGKLLAYIADRIAQRGM
ncbi:MAG: hypothetical protein R3236_00770 [Phycisphaeraceae bacterium]|nr:hypothetical protein [Phycisphaeraceae bacterium]